MSLIISQWGIVIFMKVDWDTLHIKKRTRQIIEKLTIFKQSNLFSIQTFRTINSFYVMIWYTYNRGWRQFIVCIFIMSAKYWNGRNVLNFLEKYTIKLSFFESLVKRYCLELVLLNFLSKYLTFLYAMWMQYLNKNWKHVRLKRFLWPALPPMCDCCPLEISQWRLVPFHREQRVL